MRQIRTKLKLDLPGKYFCRFFNFFEFRFLGIVLRKKSEKNRRKKQEKNIKILKLPNLKIKIENKVRESLIEVKKKKRTYGL